VSVELDAGDDRCVNWTDLTAFEGDTLYALARLEGDEETSYGLAVKRVLQDLYDEEINHGRLYPALDALVEYGVVEKSALDKRTNEYVLTDAGRVLLRRRIDLLADALVGGESA